MTGDIIGVITLCLVVAGIALWGRTVDSDADLEQHVADITHGK